MTVVVLRGWTIGVWVCAAAVAAVLASACGGDGGASTDAGDATAGGATVPDRSSDGAVPSGSEPAAVAPYIEDLLAAQDRVVNQIVADPAVVEDPDGPLVREYVELYEPDSQSVALALDTWAAQSTAGTSTQPYSVDHAAFVSRVDGPVETVSEDEVRFPTCDEQRYGIYDAAGALVEVQPLATVPGEGVAVRVDGEWKLRRLDLFAEMDECGGGG